ncbi:hypothetical protein HK103_003144 [Boothiomyces macroporosus]|uniref:Uncharacterized protein n=1 Tax=Boothiomyces macroporosus TaxID=261099 RepID=A0AAD5Y6K7_9FUNG|nr:hypothetical protein HK103_003144 [Boothiomyces macroporosus]
MRGFKFRAVEMGLPLSEEMFTHLPQTNGITVRLWPEDFLDDKEFDHLLNCRLIRKIVIDNIECIEFQDIPQIYFSIANSIFENLSVWNNLSSLTLCQEGIDYSLLSKALPKTNMTKLKIFLGSGVQQLFPIIENTKLKSLTLADCMLRDRDLVKIAGYLEKWKIERLNLGFGLYFGYMGEEYPNSFSDWGHFTLADAIPKSKLKYLDLRSSRNPSISADAVEAIFDTIPHSNLLKFGFTRQRHQSLMDLPIVQNLKHYDSDTLELYHYDKEFYSILARNIIHTKFEEIELRVPENPFEMSELLECISKCLSIKNIKLSSVVYFAWKTDLKWQTEAYCKVFSPYINTLPITEFYIHGLNCAAKLLKSIDKNSKMKKLGIMKSIGWKWADQNVLNDLARYVANSNIQEIDFRNGFFFDDWELDIIADFFKAESLNTVHISVNEFAEMGVIGLAQKLKQLNFKRPINIHVQGKKPPYLYLMETLGERSLVHFHFEQT